MITPLRVLLPSDVFPPRCGGAGWSAHALALALIERGHAITAIVPRRVTKDDGRWTISPIVHRPSSFVHHPPLESVLGVPTIRVNYWAPRIPIIQNYFRYERFWPRLADVVAGELSASPAQLTIIHAQHVQVTPAALT